MNWKDFAILKALLGNGGGGGGGSGAKYPDKVTIITESRELTAHDQGIVFVTGQTVTLPSVAADGTTYKFVGSLGDVIINTNGKTITGIGSGAAIRLGDSYTEIYAINSPGLLWDVRSRSTVGAYTSDKTYKKSDIAADSGLHYLSIADENTGNALSETTKWLPLTTDIAAQTNAASAKNPPVDADIMPLADSASSFTLKKLTLAILFLWIVSKVAALSSKATPVDADSLLIIDSEASNVGKRLTFANLKTWLSALYAPIAFYNAARNIARVEKTTHTQYNTTIPLDNSIPQSGEGSEIFTVSHTPTSASNYVRVRAVICYSQDQSITASILTAALFKDSNANAVAAVNSYSGITNFDGQMVIDYRVLAGSTAAATWKIRVGSSSGNNFTVSGRGGAGLYGGVYISSLTVSEEPV